MSSVSIRRHFAHPLNEVPVLEGLATPDELVTELLGMANVVLGREPAPVDNGVLTRHEVCLAYHARACEIEMLIFEHERTGKVTKGSDYYRIRTGALRSFLEMIKRQVEAGSRALTHEQFLFQMQMDGNK